MGTLKDISDEIGYSRLKKYLFPSRPLKGVELIMEKNDEEEEEEDDDERLLEKVETAVNNEDVALLNKNNNCDEMFIDSGEPFNVIRLLTGGDKRKGHYLTRLSGEIVQHNQLEGKYVMICCFTIPEFLECDAWTAVAASNELYRHMHGNFEMVIVGHMRRGWSGDDVAFCDFLAPFPRRCLYVPFKDKALRGLICYFLGIASLPFVFLVDPHGEVLLYEELNAFSPILLVPWYGRSIQPFPFIRAFCKKLPSDADDLKQPSSLQDCLWSKIVFKISYSERSYIYHKVSISIFKSKVVGLYLYTDGELLPLIRKMNQDCTESGKDMEIMIMNLPLSLDSYHSLFPKHLARALAKQNLSWWVAPFNFSAYSILNHLFHGGEKLLVKEPKVDFVEPRGAEFFKVHGIDAYPFTQSSGYSL